MSSERRKNSRRQVVNLNLIMQSSSEIIGKVVNLSDEGLLAILNRSLNNNEIYQLKINFTNIRKEELKVEFGAIVIWCSENLLDNSKYSAGMKIVNNSLAQSALIQHLSDMSNLTKSGGE